MFAVGLLLLSQHSRSFQGLGLKRDSSPVLLCSNDGKYLIQRWNFIVIEHLNFDLIKIIVESCKKVIDSVLPNIILLDRYIIGTLSLNASVKVKFLP